MLDKIAYGSSPEKIHFQHPHLSLAQIHAALTYYYENQSQLDAQIQRGLEESDKLAAELSDPEFRRKLVNLKQRSWSVAFYMDVHVPRALTVALRLRGDPGGAEEAARNGGCGQDCPPYPCQAEAQTTKQQVRKGWIEGDGQISPAVVVQDV